MDEFQTPTTESHLKTYVIAGSIGVVVVGLVIAGIVIYRHQALSGPSPSAASPPASNQPAAPLPNGGKPSGPKGTASATGTSAGIGGVTHVAPDYTNAPDADHDGLSDPEEALYGTDPHNADTDSDGLKDGDEVHHTGTDPKNPKSNATSPDRRYPEKK